MKLYVTYLKQYIKNYPARLTFLVIGVLIAVLFTSYMGMLTDSIHSTNREKRTEKYGDFQGYAIGISPKDTEIAEANNAIQDISYSDVVGTVTAGYEKVYVGVMDEKAQKLARLQLKQGSLPTADNEIAIEDVVLKSMCIEVNIGDKIEFEIMVTQGGESKTIKRVFVLSGIFENKPLRTLLENSYASGGAGLEHAVMPALLISPTELYTNIIPKGQKIDNIKLNSKVCVEVHEMLGLLYEDIDGVCDVNVKYNSVIILGHAKLLTDIDAKREILKKIVNKYTPQFSEEVLHENMVKGTGVIEVEIKECTGKYYK